ncbi:MAG: T9SS type A sorting domain-containing protein [Crocinitomix sp.]|nr:T9SS type A sorting domain-containing protein [Crocinitomix sp.]
MNKIINILIINFLLILPIYSQTNQYLNFDGVNDVAIDDECVIDFSTNYTVELKFKRFRMNVREDLFNKKELFPGPPPSLNDFAFFITDDNIFNILYRKTADNQVLLRSTTTITNAAWYHVVFVKQGSSLKMYVNGIVEDSDNSFENITSHGPFWIGSNRTESLTPTNSFPFQGSLDELRMWNIARTPADLIANMNLELIGDEPNLVNYYDFNEGIPCENNIEVVLLPNLITENNAELVNFDLTGTLIDTCFSNWAGIQRQQNISVGDELNLEDIYIFPNPASDQVTIAGINLGVEITITDVTGNVISTNVALNEILTIDISNYAKGIYFIQIYDNQSNSNEKMVKKLIIN